MFYYEVAIGSKNRSAQPYFTYNSDAKLSVGQVVEVYFRNKKAKGFVVKISSEPEFKTHSIASHFELYIPGVQVKTFLTLVDLYPFSSQMLAQLFLPPSLVKKNSPETARERLDIVKPEPLSKEQTAAYELITSSQQSVMLFGDTGTGKTRVYMHLIQQVLEAGKNVILLAPEIGLASILYERVKAYFPQTILYHSALTSQKRREHWQEISNTKHGLLIVGPRSALTLPVQNIGLIILDESHDQSYRQDNQPYIQARSISSLLAKYSGSKCVYGTATPNVSDFYFANKLGIPVATMKQLAAGDRAKTTVKIISYDSDAERLSGSVFLKTSKEVLADTFKRGGQALILMNKRGTARYVSCDSCGYEERCEACDHLLTYHHDLHRMLCHTCMRQYPVRSVCPDCTQPTLSMRSLGTKAVEAEILKLFPSINVRRFDTDSGKNEHLSAHAKTLYEGEVDCIIGTQMIAKGLDLPKLETLLVLGSGFNGNGFAGEEREFQLLYQVIGRARRGHRDTNVIIQSHNPQSPILASAIERTYETFYESELIQRKQFTYPPFCHLGIIHYNRKSPESAEKAGKALIVKLKKIFPSIEFMPPMANTNERHNDTYHWHMLMKSNTRTLLVEVARQIGTNWICELDPIDTP